MKVKPAQGASLRPLTTVLFVIVLYTTKIVLRTILNNEIEKAVIGGRVEPVFWGFLKSSY